MIKRGNIMSSENMYQPPASDLGGEAPNNTILFRGWRRFYISLLWSFPIYMFLVILSIQKGSLITGAIGSTVFAVGTGLVAAFIPAKRKMIFVPLSIVTGLIVAFLIGTYFGN
jgi:hypothetical protein